MNDLRYSIRVLIKNPGFTAMAVLSLALGIGANAAIFSLFDAVLLKTLPIRQPEQLVFLETGEPSLKRSSNISYRTYERLRAQDQVLADACYFGFTTRINASFNGAPEVIEGQLVSGSFFATVGVDAAVGRTLLDTDDREDANHSVAVISDGYWKRRFGASPLIVGQNVVMNDRPFTVVGVTPPECFGVIVGSAPDVFLPSRSGELIVPRRTRIRGIVGMSTDVSRPSRSGELIVPRRTCISVSRLPFILVRLRDGSDEVQARSALSLVLQQAALKQGGSEATREKVQHETMRMLRAA